VAIPISADEAALLIAKYQHDDFPELVNYVAFSHTADPQLAACERFV
jgi:hypothetical protein